MIYKLVTVLKNVFKSALELYLYLLYINILLQPCQGYGVKPFGLSEFKILWSLLAIILVAFHDPVTM